MDANDGIVIVSNSGLRDHTRLSAFVTESIRGDIHVGQVNRLQAGGLDPFQATGNISANLYSYGIDSAWVGNGRSIAYVQAGNSISGTFTAAYEGTWEPSIQNFNYAGIGDVIVGPNTAAAGFTGDLIAEKGRISKLWCSGPIGSPERLSKFWAADGIEEVRAISAFSLSTVPADMYVDIQAGRNYPASEDFVNVGYLGYVESGGKIAGQIKAGNLFARTNQLSLNQGIGIFAAGPIEAPITIDQVAVYTNIAATKFTQPITIGRLLQGAIVAYGARHELDPEHPDYDPTDGTIHSVSIGRAPVANPDPYRIWARGMTGLRYTTPRNIWRGPIAGPHPTERGNLAARIDHR